MKKKLNITLDPEVLDEFCKYASKYGTSISSWIEVKMKDLSRKKKKLKKLENK